MHIIAARRHPHVAVGQASLPTPRTLVRRLAQWVGLRLVRWAARRSERPDRETGRHRHESDTARAERERRWHAAASLGAPLR